MTFSDQDYSFLTALIKKRSGIHLADDKAYLLESRLLPVTRKFNFKSIEDLVKQLRLTNDEKLAAEVTEAMTTNESSFFRDLKPFDFLKQQIMPQLIAAHPNKKTFRIWSAACSTGQEPYSIAISLLEAPGCASLQFEIVATDIASHVLNKAKEGCYSQFEVQRGMPIALLLKYFKQEGDNWHIKDQIKSMVKFELCNLVSPPPSMGVFDIIFCRNVLIYFDAETKTQVLHYISKQIEPHGYLFLGCAESIFGLENKFTLLPGAIGIYTLK